MATTYRRSVARQVNRPSSGRALAFVVLTWGVAIGFVLTVAADTRIGPVVFRLTKTHGVHLGDLYATLGCAGVALLITVWIVVDHMGRKRRWERAQRRETRARTVHHEPDDDEAYDQHDGASDEYGYDEQHDEYYDEYYDDAEGQHALRSQRDDEPDSDLVDTVLIERDTGDYTGRHRPHR